MDTLPVFAIERHRLTTDGEGVITLVGAYGCPLRCKYCLNPHAWNPKTLEKCKLMTAEELYDTVKIDDLYFKATGGGITFGGGESLLHADFIKEFRECCGKDWCITVETSLNVPKEQLGKALEAVDAFIVDIKDMNCGIYKKYTGVSNEQVLGNLELLAGRLEEKKVRIRIPQIPGYNGPEAVKGSVEIVKGMGFSDVEVFPYVIRN